MAKDLGIEANKVLKMECNSQLGYFYRVTRKVFANVRRSKVSEFRKFNGG